MNTWRNQSIPHEDQVETKWTQFILVNECETPNTGHTHATTIRKKNTKKKKSNKQKSEAEKNWQENCELTSHL